MRITDGAKTRIIRAYGRPSGRSGRCRSSRSRARGPIGAVPHISALSVEAHGRRTELVLPPRGADDRLVGAVRHLRFGIGIEIGRESCRERVCQYVSISVVAVSLKKKNKKKLEI